MYKPAYEYHLSLASGNFFPTEYYIPEKDGMQYVGFYYSGAGSEPDETKTDAGNGVGI